MHVLGTPPAFILSQDQTRHTMSLRSPSRLRPEGEGGIAMSCDPGQAVLVNTWLFADVTDALPARPAGQGYCLLGGLKGKALSH